MLLNSNFFGEVVSLAEVSALQLERLRLPPVLLSVIHVQNRIADFVLVNHLVAWLHFADGLGYHQARHVEHHVAGNVGSEGYRRFFQGNLMPLSAYL